MSTIARIGIVTVTVSDRASAGIYEDISGKEIERVLGEYLSSPWQAEYRLVADEQPLIEAALCELVDQIWDSHHCNLGALAAGCS